MRAGWRSWSASRSRTCRCASRFTGAEVAFAARQFPSTTFDITSDVRIFVGGGLPMMPQARRLQLAEAPSQSDQLGIAQLLPAHHRTTRRFTAPARPANDLVGRARQVDTPAFPAHVPSPTVSLLPLESLACFSASAAMHASFQWITPFYSFKDCYRFWNGLGRLQGLRRRFFKTAQNNRFRAPYTRADTIASCC